MDLNFVFFALNFQSNLFLFASFFPTPGKHFFLLKNSASANCTGEFTTKAIKLMHFPKLCHQIGRCNAITNFPTGTVIHFTKRKGNKTALKSSGYFKITFMLYAIKNDMFIYFVTQD